MGLGGGGDRPFISITPEQVYQRLQEAEKRIWNLEAEQRELSHDNETLAKANDILRRDMDALEEQFRRRFSGIELRLYGFLAGLIAAVIYFLTGRPGL